MANQWTPAANTNNPYDASGYIYATAIDTPFSTLIDKLYPKSSFFMGTLLGCCPI